MSKFSTSLIAALAAVAILAAPVAVSAMGSGGGSSSTAKKVDPDYTQGVKAVDAQDWKRAITLLTGVVQRDNKNADAFNYLGYSFRKSGDYDSAFISYKKALKINPDHKGAHEYIGEAYLETGDLAQAEAHLKRLDSLCLFGCAEYTALKKAVAAYKANQQS